MPTAGRCATRTTLARIRRLAIPPAWTGVWICPLADGHLQATGRDARGRKQYRYHADWQALRDEDKFERLEAFGRALPRIRARVARDLSRRRQRRATRPRSAASWCWRRSCGCSTPPSCASATRSTRGSNGSYGLTTLRNRHAGVSGATLRLRFRGKSGVMHAGRAARPRASPPSCAAASACPGRSCSSTRTRPATPHRIDSGDVNDYLARRRRRRLHRQGLPHLARQRAGAGADPAGLRRAAPPATTAARRRASARRRCWRRWRAGSATRRRCAARPTSIRRCWSSAARLAADAAEMARFAAGSGGDAVPPRSGLSAAERRFTAFLARPAGRRQRRGTAAPAATPRRGGDGMAAAAQQA